jgi:ribonucleoside-triphosphate reductase
MEKCKERTEVYSRVTGYYSPLHRWNKGKREEYKERVPYKGAIAPTEGN